MRRSWRLTTVAAIFAVNWRLERSRSSKAFQVRPAARLGERRVVVDRMGAEIGADRRELALQPLRRRPRLGGDEEEPRRLAGAAEEIEIAACGALRPLLRGGEHAADILEHLRAVGIEAVEGARLRQAFERLAVQDLRIDARREIGEVGEGPVAAQP